MNLNDQMLLALKAEAVATEAIESIKKGESPVIYVDSTLEAALTRHLESSPANVGDEIDFSYRDLLRRYLERSREVLIQRDASDKNSTERYRLTDEELGPEAVEAYEMISNAIDKFDVNMPSSPIDLIRKRIEEAGYTVGEITGRKNTLNYSDDGKVFLGTRPKDELGAAGKTNTVKRFNEGSLDVVILNQSVQLVSRCMPARSSRIKSQDT